MDEYNNNGMNGQEPENEYTQGSYSDNTGNTGYTESRNTGAGYSGNGYGGNGYDGGGYNGDGGSDRRQDTRRPKKKGKGGKVAAVVLASLLGVGAVSGASYAGFSYLAEKNGTGSYSTEAATDADTRNASLTEAAETEGAKTAVADSGTKAELSTTANLEHTGADSSVQVLDVSDVVSDVKPSVVSVTNTILYTAQFAGQTTSQTSEAAGSGVIVSEADGTIYILTNNHVVDVSSDSSYYTTSSDGYTVEFVDGTSATATLKGTDEEHDLAILAVNTADLDSATLDSIKIATIGNSDEMKEGQGVIAIGNALGYGLSVTVGYISATDRTVNVNGNENTFLQTDAAINPGNSGGGLFNTNGELIGINDAKLVDEEVEGVGYAIPVSSVTDLITELMNEEPRTALTDDERGYLGIYGQDIDSSMSSVYNLPEGVYLTYIQEGSPAEDAGMKVRDIITGIGGKKVTSMSDLRDKISTYAAGEEVEIKLYSMNESGEYEEKTVTVTLGSYAAESQAGNLEVPNQGNSRP